MKEKLVERPAAKSVKKTAHKKRVKSRRKAHKQKKRIGINKLGWITLAFVAVVIIGSFGYATYAKYFSESAKAGIAIASGVYFTASYAVDTPDTAGSNEFFESLVTSEYTGGTYNFVFTIKNYENNLLFNESTVTIPYSVSFWLGAEPVNAYYTVSTADNSQSISLEVGESKAKSITGQSIAGGSAKTNTYTVALNVTGSGTHVPVPIYVRVTTDEGAVIDKNLCGKMVLKTSSAGRSFIESQQFSVQNQAGADADKYTEILTQSEFMYDIRTVGDVVSDEEVTEEIRLMWDPTVFEIDAFGEAYLEWLDTAVDGTKPTGPGTCEVKVTVNGTETTENWNYFIVKAMPYSSESIGFFRGVQFNAKVTDWTTMHQYIKAEKNTTE